MDQALINASIFTGEERLENKALLISNGKIHSIVDPVQIPESFKLIDLSGLTIAPGLIDLQIPYHDLSVLTSTCQDMRDHSVPADRGDS
jgi:N-acetylglucosamine-6-phosphate deacetylase